MKRHRAFKSVSGEAVSTAVSPRQLLRMKADIAIDELLARLADAEGDITAGDIFIVAEWLPRGKRPDPE